MTLGTLISTVYAAFLPRYGPEVASIITALFVAALDSDLDEN